ncbi:MAG: ATPase [Actinomycetota bacterium]|nr:ATPase [Actinomycetota bacterium]
MDPVTDPQALAALARADLDWTMHLRSVWSDDGALDVAAIHARARSRVLDTMDALSASPGEGSPLGIVVLGAAGAGKTHLIAALRREVLTKGLGFVLADLTDVREFWPTVLQGYVSSLHQPVGEPQLRAVLDIVLATSGVAFDRAALAAADVETHRSMTGQVLSGLAATDRATIMRHRDTIRAFALLDADDFELAAMAHNWFDGVDLGEERAACGLSTGAADPAAAVEGLSYLMALRGPTMLALDQIDSIVAQHHLASDPRTGDSVPSAEQQAARSIIQGLGGGLLGLRDRTTRTLTVLSCLEQTWDVLANEVVASARARFHSPHVLGMATRSAPDLLAARLARSYGEAGFEPPYATWPFSDDFLREAAERSPREILRRAAEHRDACVSEGVVRVLDGFGSTAGPTNGHDDRTALDHAFSSAREEADPRRWLGAEEDRLSMLLRLAAEAILVENPTDADVDGFVDTDFAGARGVEPLHCRLRLVHHDAGDRETHLSFRAIQNTHHRSFQSRLQAAMTASGIDRDLTFRRLVVVRTTPLPAGPKSKALFDAFRRAGGELSQPTEDEIRTLGALYLLAQDHPEPALVRWLAARRPVSTLPCFASAVSWLFTASSGLGAPPVTAGTPVPAFRSVPGAPGRGTRPGAGANGHDLDTSRAMSPTSTTRPPGSPEAAPAATGPGDDEASRMIPLGRRVVGGGLHDRVAVPVADLRRHGLVLGGAGSGHTLLLRRLVEEAALVGVPSIVVDASGAMARLGDRWPAAPDGWSDGDADRALRYHDTTDVVLWTPGLAGGNPLVLDPIPDLAAVAPDPDELAVAVGLATDALAEVVAPGAGNKDQLKRKVLGAALGEFGRRGGGWLGDLVGLLGDLPPTVADAPLAAGERIDGADRLAAEMADQLGGEMLNNRLLRAVGSPTDVGTLLGADGDPARTRVSVVALEGLADGGARSQLVNQLAMALFGWIRTHPAGDDRGVRGLLVIDEVKDLLGANDSSAVKRSLLGLFDQARLHGLGVLVATQEPRGLDERVTAATRMHLIGRFSSPGGIAAARDLLRPHGARGRDVPRLDTRQFFAFSDAVQPVAKIAAPPSLSHDAPSPLSVEQLEERASRSRRSLDGARS